MAMVQQASYEQPCGYATSERKTESNQKYSIYIKNKERNPFGSNNKRYLSMSTYIDKK